MQITDFFFIQEKTLRFIVSGGVIAPQSGIDAVFLPPAHADGKKQEQVLLENI